MTLETTYRSALRPLAVVLLAAALANCSSTQSSPGTTSGGTTGTSGGTTSAAGSAVSTAGTSSVSTAGTSSGGAPGVGGTAAVGGASVGSDGKGGTGGGGGSGGVVASAGTGGAGQAGATGSCPTVSAFATWPANKAPLDIGKLAVNNFKSHTGDAYTGAGYAWTFAYVGSLQFTKLTGDTATNATLISGFERYASGSTAPPSNTSSSTVDDRAFGDLPLEIFMENQDARSKKLGLDRADMQWANPTSDGITSDARYWADDMFMITGLQVYAYRATNDSKYLDRSAKTMVAYLAALQQADGLFWHTKTSHAYWGRANGWIAAGMTELLLDLPTGSVRDSIMAGYKKQMDGLLAVQIASGTDAGAWRQVLDVAADKPESSCTAMFTFALATGVKNGWLTDAKYATAAQNGWIALGNKTDSTGGLQQVCPGTGAAPDGSLASQQAFYQNLTFGSNDQHGQAALLWAARALLRTDCPGVR